MKNLKLLAKDRGLSILVLEHSSNPHPKELLFLNNPQGSKVFQITPTAFSPSAAAFTARTTAT